MRKENLTQNIVIAILAVTVLLMTVGYASFVRTLSINNSTAVFKQAKWDVHFDNESLTETSAIHANTTPTVSNDSVSFNVTLAKPGDVYSFKVSAKNYGTIDAKMNKITMSGLTEDEAKFIEYTVTYAGETYTQTTEGLNFPLAANASHSIVVTVKYLLPSDPTELPSEEDYTLNLSADFDYVDAIS